jgi:hypothetical protein
LQSFTFRRNEAIILLVQCGADINQRKTIKQGPQTALEMARANAYKLTEKVLKDLGAKEPEKDQYEKNSILSA